ncbi:MAG: lactonase family protein [Lachnospiraceae bacterium]|nr:lactonase family protein [Lachnospiraceae bacterium]MDD3795598.1 lactonase family protein [Lachnospiraceae bacterium]
MEKKKYVAYVGTYTHGSSIGIHVYDIDMETGSLTERNVIPVNNASYLTKSYNGKYLYSIADEGVEVLKIEADGDLTPINKVGIDGMRGCYLSTDATGKFLFVGGYHDGKVTVVHTHRNGRLGSVMDGVFHQGMGSVAERNFRPHVSCVIPSPDGKYLCAVDNGIDQVKIYRVNPQSGKLTLHDILRCELESGPRLLCFSKNGKFAYVNCELTNQIRVYSYDGSGKYPKFELLQEVKSLMDEKEVSSACCAMKISPSGKYLYCSSAGENTVGIFEINDETGLLEKICILPISGGYPKDIDVLPDEKTMVVLCHESNYMRFFTIDYEKKVIVMKGRQLKVETPNSILISETEAGGTEDS